MPRNPPHDALRRAVNKAIAEGSPVITEIAPTENPYRVWRAFDQRPDEGVEIMAVSSFEARRKYAADHGGSYQDCAARRIDREG